MLDTIGRTIAEEFADGSDVAGLTRVVLRLLMAASLGALLGYEREQKGKSAGLRTHMLVCLGAALFVLIPQQAGVLPGEMTRVFQGLIAGIGFLGAGAIIKLHTPPTSDRPGDMPEDTNIRGLTTAAGIWMTAAIGMAAGLGREMTAILSTALALIVLALPPKIDSKRKK